MDNSNGSESRLKLIGGLHPSSAFVLRPIYHPDQSIEFCMRMRIPAAIYFAVGCIPLIIGIIEGHPISASNLLSPIAYSLYGIAGFFFIIGLFALCRWQSVMVGTDGRVTLNTPKIIGRAIQSIESEHVWVDLVTREITNRRHRSFENEVKRRWELDGLEIPTLSRRLTPVIHDKDKAFLIAYEKNDEMHALQQLLLTEYSMQCSDQPWTVRYKGLCTQP